MSKLKERDRDTLSRALDLHRRFAAGIFPTGAGQHARFAKLERLGLLRIVGMGRDIDGEVDRDVIVYELTAAGVAAASRAG